MAANTLSCFKAYDIRGVVPDELNDELAYEIGVAYADIFTPTTVAVGRDVRPSGEGIVRALIKGLTDRGIDVMDIGVVGTEQVYFATGFKGLSGGMMVTASHNPPEYNGIKMVREEAMPMSSETGLMDIESVVRRRINEGRYKSGTSNLPNEDIQPGKVEYIDLTDEYVDHLLTYVDVKNLKPFKVVANAGNGSAGTILEQLASHLPFEMIIIHKEPDGTFPNGVPNPMLTENQHVTGNAVLEHGADLGVAWDGDFDRCFFFDEKGQFVEGYYIVGLFAANVLKAQPGATIIHDPKLTWNSIDVIKSMGGHPVQHRTGHAFIKDRMRRENAAYGGEVSAHHYFRDFYFCDSGMIPFLMMTDILSKSGRPLSEMIAERAIKYPVSGEINRKVTDARQVLQRLEHIYVTEQNGTMDTTDGLGVNFENWRFNVRSSNTEPLLRLNVETKGDPDLLREKTDELLAHIEG